MGIDPSTVELVPDWAKEQNQYSNNDSEVSKDSYDFSGNATSGERGQQNAVGNNNTLLRISRREAPETFKIG